MKSVCPLRLLSVAASLGILGCGTLGPSEPLTVSLEVSETTIRSGDSFVARLVIENHGSEEVTLVSPHACLALPAIYRGGRRENWVGTVFGCWDAVTNHIIEAGRRLERDFPMRAAVGENSSGPSHPAQPGLYELWIDMEVPLADPPGVTIRVE